MSILDMVIMPLGCIACGMLAAASLLSRTVPGFHKAAYLLLPFKTFIGLVTILASAASFAVPASGPPVFGSLFPAASGMLAGALLAVELLTDSRIGKNRKLLITQIGNALIYLKIPIGLAAMFFGLMHLMFAEALFF